MITLDLIISIIIRSAFDNACIIYLIAIYVAIGTNFKTLFIMTRMNVLKLNLISIDQLSVSIEQLKIQFCKN